MAEECSIHKLKVQRVCGLVQCCCILCPSCFVEHQMETGHHLAVRMGSQALDFFSCFTGFVQYKLLGWADAVRHEGTTAFFRVESIDKEGLAQIRPFCSEVLQNYAQLMRGNRQFVMAQQDTPLINHPEFLKDLFNFVVQSWDTSAQVIVDNLKKKLQENFGTRYSHLIIEVQPHLMAMFQQERINLLKKAGDILVESTELSQTNPIQPSPEVAKDAIGEQNKQNMQLQSYFPPWSIRKIESVEEIIQKHQSSCSIKQNLPIPMPTPDPITETDDQHNYPHDKTAQLLQEHKQLQDENEMLKLERDQLLAINQNLTQQRLPSANNISLEHQRPSTTYLQTVLLAKIKQLQAQLADRQSDLSLLTRCLIELTATHPTDRNLLSTRLINLRSMVLRL